MNENYKIHIANETERNEAYNLALQIFQNGNSTESKYISWFGKSVPDEVVVIKENQKVIGCVRIAPLQISYYNLIYNVSNLTSICISPEHQGKKLSSSLMNFTLNYCASKFNLGLVIARRSVDYYYLKFGFTGISTYDKLILKNSIHDNIISNSVELKDYTSYDFSNSIKMYENSYGKCNGYVIRNQKNWLNIQKVIESNSLFHFKWITSNQELAGYIVYLNNSPIEFSISDNGLSTTQIKALIHLHNNTLTLPISSSHTFYSLLQNIDFIISKRNCSYGGHMIIRYNDNSFAPNTIKDSLIHEFNINELDQL